MIRELDLKQSPPSVQDVPYFAALPGLQKMSISSILRTEDPEDLIQEIHELGLKLQVLLYTACKSVMLWPFKTLRQAASYNKSLDHSETILYLTCRHCQPPLFCLVLSCDGQSMPAQRFAACEGSIKIGSNSTFGKRIALSALLRLST